MATYRDENQRKRVAEMARRNGINVSTGSSEDGGQSEVYRNPIFRSADQQRRVEGMLERQGFSTAVRYSGYYQKYNGQTYGQLQDVLSKMEDGEEKEWLTKYAPSTITDRDYAVKSAQNNTELYYAEKYLDEYAKIVLDSSLRMSDQPQGYAARNIQQESDLLPEIKALNEKYGFRNKQEAEARIEELKAQNWEYQKTREYGFLGQNADYGELSSVVTDDKTAGAGIGIGTRWFGQGDPVYDYINNIDGAREVHPAQEGKTPYSIYDYMDEKEIADYNYLYNAQGKEAAQGYLDYLKYTLDQRRMEKLRENTAAYATDHPVISSALSVQMNLLSGAGVLDVAGQYAARKISGEYKPINYNRSGMVPTAVTTATRGTVAKNIADATGTISLDTEKHPILSRILNGKSLGDVYQLGMSMADSAAIAGLAAVGIPGGTALLGGSAASQGVLDALEAGADDTQALTMGILNGVFEMLFEEVSLEKLLKGNTKGIVRSILEQGAVEGSEEFFTTLANTVADTLVMAEKSDYRSKIAEYMSQGLSENKATLRAIEDIAIGMGWDFVGGMLTGGIMGGASKPIQNYIYASEAGNLLYGSEPGALVSEALEIDPENKLAARMKGKLDSGESVSGNQLYKLAQQKETALRGQDTNAIQQAASERLKELGETGDVEAISAALAKQAAGETLKKSEAQLIQDSKYGNRVSQELNQDNIRSGDYASDWAKNIGTKRIGLDVYNLGKTETADVQSSESVDGTKNDSSARNTLNTESKTAQNDFVRQAPAEDKPFELSNETGKTLLNRADGSTVETEITGIASTGNGKLMLNVAGQSQPVKASSISYASTADATLYNAINSMEISPEDAKRFVNLARSSVDTTGEFAVGIQQMYILGKSGVPISKAMNSRYGAKLSDTNKRFGYSIGRAVYDAQVQKAEAEKKNVAASQRARASAGGTKVNGVQYDGLTVSKGNDGSVAIDGVTLNAQQKAGIHAAEMLAKMGVNIHVFRSRTDANGKPIGENGSYSMRDGSIHIDLNAGNLGQGMMAYTIAHEFTHFMEQQSPAKFQAFTDAIFSELDIDVEAEIERKAKELKQNRPEQYKNASRETLLEDARSEVVAEACETMLTDTDAAQRIGQSLKAKDATLFEKVKQWFRNLAAKLREAYKGLHPDSEIAQYAKKTIQQVDSLVQMWAEMAVDAAENYRTAVTHDSETRKTNDEVGVKLSIRNTSKMSWEDQLSANRKGTLLSSDSFYLGETPAVYGEGFSKYPLIMNQSDFKKCTTKKHNVPNRVFKRLPSLIANPIMSFTQDGRTAAVLDDIDADGKPLVVALHAFEQMDRETVTAVTSVYGVDNWSSWVENQSRKNIRIHNKARANSILQTYGSNASVEEAIRSTEEIIPQVLTDVNEKFSMRSTVEETKDLIAVHNLSEEKLLKSLNLGGLPMPSIAILRAKDGHSKFGEISLVFSKDTIDPELSRFNKVYSADAWTPTYPKIDYKANAQVEERINGKYSDLVKRFGYDAAKPLYRYAYELEDILNRYGGESGLIENLDGNTDMMQLYLLESGREEVQPIYRETRQEISQDEMDMNRYFINNLGMDIINSILVPGESGPEAGKKRRDAIKKYDAEIREVYKGFYKEQYGLTDEEAASEVSGYSARRFLKDIRDAYNFTQSNGISVRTEVDSAATKEAIRNAAKDGYTQWVRDLFTGAEEKSGIRNEKDLFTPSGKRRSFEALHYENNLENVVKAMREKGEKGIGNFGGGSIFGVSTTEFSSVDEIKQAKSRLQTMSVEEYQKIKKGFSDRFFELASSLPKNKNSFTAIDDAANMLIEAVAKCKTKSGMVSYLKKESQGWANYSDYVVDDLVELVRDIRSMPTGYFEAKPQRAVGFDEIVAVVAPDNLSEETTQKLTDLGMNVVSYEHGNEESRTDALNSLDGVKFSNRNTTEEVLTRQNESLEKQNGKLRDDVERLRELLKLQGKTTGGKLFKPESIKTAANFIMRETGRILDADGKAEFAGILTKAYTALSDENVTYDDIIRECTNVAQWLDENGETKDALDEYAGGILSQMKGIPISLDETQKAEARHLYGSLREFRSRIAGTYKLSPDGVPLDDVWNGLSMEHPMFFDGDASSAGLPGLLVEAIDRLRGCVNTDPYQHMPVDMMMRKVYDGFWKAKKLTTVADRYQSKIDAINAKHDAAMLEMQEAHKAEIADLNRQWDAEAAAMEKSHKYDLEEQERLHKEHLRKVREEMNHDAKAELEKVIGKYTDQRKASVENRHRTQYREQIYKMADKFHKMATAPAKANTAHAPIQLVNAVA